VGQSSPAGRPFPDFALAGYTDNGKLDTSFGPHGTGLVTTSFGADTTSEAFAAALQHDCTNSCKIVVAGYSVTPGALNKFVVSDTPEFALARYTSNGCLDKSFGEDKTGKVVTDFVSGSTDQARAITIQKNGEIVAAGYTYAITPDNPGGNDVFALARYNQCQPCC
jgi:uncharacterized delta-60 repeat protein